MEFAADVPGAYNVVQLSLLETPFGEDTVHYVTSRLLFLALVGGTTGVLAQDLVAYFEFDGDFCDSSGNDLHGTPLGAATIVFDDERDSDVLSLDGIDSTVSLGNSPLFDWNGAFSAAFWMKVESWQGGWDTVLKKESIFSFERNQTLDELTFYHWPNFRATTVTVPAGKSWHHVAATFDGLEQKIYLDGELVSTLENVGDMHTNSAPVYVGSNGSSRYFHGFMDELQIYDLALSADDVYDLSEDIPVDPVDPVDPEDPPTSRPFVRGDVDNNGQVNLTDVIFNLNFLFLGGDEPSCFDAGDADNNGIVQLTDGIFLLNYLFLVGSPPPEPHEECGSDPDEPADDLGCETFDRCA